MINKTGAMLLLAQPFKYASHIFGNSATLKKIASSNQWAVPSLRSEKVGNVVIDAGNFKSKLSVSCATAETLFFNCLTSLHGGVKIEGNHIGRVFNRSLLPTKKDCFFSTGNMGTSNGSVTPKIPVDWTPEGSDYAKGDVFSIQILNTGETGEAKFRYTSYPFDEIVFSKSGNTPIAPQYPFYIFYSETGCLLYNPSAKTVTLTNDYESCEVDGVWAESRLTGNDKSVSITLASDKTKLRKYKDATFTVLEKEVQFNFNGMQTELEAVTYADNRYFGINLEKAFEIDINSGALTEIIEVSQTGSKASVFASPKQDKVFFFIDGKVKVLTLSDNSIVSPTNALSNTPEAGEIGRVFIVDVENNIWYKGKKYDGETIEVIKEIYYEENRGRHYLYSPTFLFQLEGNKYKCRDIDGEIIKEYDAYVSGSSTYTLPRYMSTVSLRGDTCYLENHFSADDLRRMKFRETLKDWKVYDGSDWVKGWYKEIPTGWISDYFLSEKSISGFKKDEIYHEYENAVDVIAGDHQLNAESYYDGSTSYQSRMTVRFEHIDSTEIFDSTFYRNGTVGWYAVNATINLPYTGKYNITVRNNNQVNVYGGLRNLSFYKSGNTIIDFTCKNVSPAILPGTFKSIVNFTTEITDNADGTLSDGGIINYDTGVFTLSVAPEIALEVYYELVSNALSGVDIELQDGLFVDFQNGAESPHFVKDDFFTFTVAKGHIVDNLEEYSTSVDLYAVPHHDEVSETFTINATSMNISKQSMTGFIKLDSDKGLTGTIAGTDATIAETTTPTAGQIGVDYNTGALFFHADDNGKQAIISYRWLERPA